jgi:uncharacterized protein (TIGR02246 family)
MAMIERNLIKSWAILSAVTTMGGAALIYTNINSSPARASSPLSQVYLPQATIPSGDEVSSLGRTWGNALAARDPKKMAALYDPKAVLIATFTNELDTPAEINNYFVGLMTKEKLQVAFNKQNIRILDENTATNSGLYTFSYMENGKTIAVPARYTFVYEKRDGKWTIVEHHSSIRPENPAR